MKNLLLLSGALALSITGGCNAQTVPASTKTVDAQQTANEIRTEALRKNNDPSGHALPLLAVWGTGSNPKVRSFDPVYQLGQIETGHHILPGFAFPNISSDAGGDAGADENAIEKKRAYYETPLKRAAALKLPITLVSTQWERLLSDDKKYIDLPPDQNPNVVTTDGKIENKVSPFGPVKLWREVGAKWASSPLMKQVQQWYPNPPLVILLSNNEHRKLPWRNVEEDARYLAEYGKGRSNEFKRKVVADGWIERYRAMQEGMRDALSKSWQSKVLFVGYNAFGGAAFGRWPGWIDYSLSTPGRINPYPLMWDGGTPSYYTDNWNPSTDFRVYSPQIESMNWIFMQKQALQLNPNFWFGFSIWDGHNGKADDKRLYYEKLGQTYTPTRYAGFAQFGLWLLRPRVIREFHFLSDGAADMESWFLALADDVDRVYQNDTLKYFWRKGELVPNHAHQHPYQSNIPDEYKNVDRWFLLDTNLDPLRPWKLDTEIPVYSLALVTGEKGNRRWLVYAESPLQDRQNVEITIPDYGKITVDVPVAGAFYVVDEKSQKVISPSPDNS
jgi:hypothetical protein